MYYIHKSLKIKQLYTYKTKNRNYRTKNNRELL